MAKQQRDFISLAEKPDIFSNNWSWGRFFLSIDSASAVFLLLKSATLASLTRLAADNNMRCIFAQLSGCIMLCLCVHIIIAVSDALLYSVGRVRREEGGELRKEVLCELKSCNSRNLSPPDWSFFANCVIRLCRARSKVISAVFKFILGACLNVALQLEDKGPKTYWK